MTLGGGSVEGWQRRSVSMLEVAWRICRRTADKMNIQGQPGSSGADVWSHRWVSRNIKTPSERPLLVPRTGALGAAGLVVQHSKYVGGC